jgi:hypothetical protein
MVELLLVGVDCEEAKADGVGALRYVIEIVPFPVRAP